MQCTNIYLIFFYNDSIHALIISVLGNNEPYALTARLSFMILS